jgi:hypothetical protein
MEIEEHASDPLAGGLMQGCQCGMEWGAALAAGAQAYRLAGAGPQAEGRALVAAQRIVAAFLSQNKSIDCRDVTGIDMSSATGRQILRFFMRTGATGSCFGMAARYAPAAFGEINAALSEEPGEPFPAPASCSSLTAHRMGASDLHTVMAAGLAGGIGLSGGACGALGAAIWLGGMGILKNGGKIGFSAPHAAEAIARFKECTGGELECSTIVGRKFESVADHSAYLREGGCSAVLEALASA